MCLVSDDRFADGLSPVSRKHLEMGNSFFIGQIHWPTSKNIGGQNQARHFRHPCMHTCNTATPVIPLGVCPTKARLSVQRKCLASTKRKCCNAVASTHYYIDTTSVAMNTTTNMSQELETRNSMEDLSSSSKPRRVETHRQCHLLRLPQELLDRIFHYIRLVCKWSVCWKSSYD
jgi:hypothetical protein